MSVLGVKTWTWSWTAAGLLLAASVVVASCTTDRESPVQEAPEAAAAQLPLGRLIFETEWGGRGSEPGQLDNPSGIAVGTDGNIYVSDSGNARVQRFTPDGEHLDTWQLPTTSRPVGLVVRPDGVTLVTDFTEDQVLVLDADGAVVATWADEADPFQAPSGIALTPQGTVLVVEFMGQRVRELDADGRFIRFLTGGPAATDYVATRAPIPGMEEMAAAGQMADMGGQVSGNPDGLYMFPSDAAVAPDGTIYVTNTHAYELLVFTSTGDFSAAWGTKGGEPGQWEIPVGVAIDQAGRIHVADSANFRVQVLDAAGEPLLTSRADERWYQTTRRIYSPTDIAVDADGRLYVADFAASKIQRFRLDLP